MTLHNETNTDIRPAFVSIEAHRGNPFELLRGHEQTQQDFTLQLDRIYFESELQKEYLLQKALPGWNLASSFYANGPLSYAVRDCARWETRQAFSDFGQPYGAGEFQLFYQAGTWVNSLNGATGTGILSLLVHIFGAPILDVISWTATALGINLGAINIHQADMPANHDFIARPGIFGPAIMPAHWYLGSPACEYYFTEEFNTLSFALKEWVIPNETVRLFCTFCRNNKTGVHNWLFVRPPVEEILFNKSSLFHERNLPVRIYDDIALAAQNAYYPEFVSTWSGELDFAAHIDWSILAGRDVTYVSKLPHGDSYTIGNVLYERFSKMNTKLKFERLCGVHSE